MIGLILKDLYILMHLYKKSLLLVTLFFAVMAFVMQSDFMLLYLILMMSFYTLGSITLDVNCHWDRYARTLPVRPSTVVSGKFLVSLIFMLAAVAYAVLVGVVRRMINGEVSADFGSSLLIIVSISLIIAGLMIPASYKWSVDKARNLLMILFLGFFLIIMVFKDQPVVNNTMDLLTGSVQLWLPWLSVGSILLYAASWAFCCRLYSRQEY